MKGVAKMPTLAERLREESCAAEGRRRAEDAGRQVQYLREDEALARETIDQLPVRLIRAARERKKSCVVLALRRGIHYNDKFRDPEDLRAHIEAFGLTPEVLTGAARTVLLWMLDPQQGLNPNVVVDRKSDTDKGRSWSDAVLIANLE